MRPFTTRHAATFLTATAILASGAVAASRVQVTRFHLDAPIERGAVIVEPIAGTDPASLESRTYADAVANALRQQGFQPTQPGTPAPLLATVTFQRQVRDLGTAPPPVSIGLGGGSFGGGVGGGGSIGFGIGKGRHREAYATELSVQLRRQSDRTVIWEGRAQNETDSRSRDAQPAAIAEKMARALFQGFPGESGRTISVK